MQRFVGARESGFIPAGDRGGCGAGERQDLAAAEARLPPPAGEIGAGKVERRRAERD
jgi:hypothetical protein